MNSAPVTTLPDISFLPALPVGDMVTLVFYFLVAFYVIFTGILYYHWNTYTNNKAVAAATYITYFAITIPLMITIATSTLII